jgi:alkylation response protein AidB-like acyl-CoA dehydrogenase
MSTDLDVFSEEVRSWLAENLERKSDENAVVSSDHEERALQARLAAGGFGGLMVPVEYGGRGLTSDHQRVFARESAAFRTPVGFAVSLGMLAPTLIAHGSEEQKRYHLPRMIRGQEVWIQLLSEPGGGSDLAGSVTKAERDGDSWVINGSKIWSTGAATADVGMCLARTNWDVPKHRGLSMFALPLSAPGVTIEPIRQADGESEFCQEFFDDVSIPLENLIGHENEGWSVAQTLLFHERNATGGVGHGEGTEGGRAVGQGIEDLKALALGGPADPTIIRRYLSEIFVASTVQRHLGRRVATGYKTGALKGQWGSVLKLGAALLAYRRAEIAFALTVADGAVWSDGTENGPVGADWLMSKTLSIAGGTNEMQRNIISERLLGLPREPSFDNDLPFREVRERIGRSV